MSANYDWSGIRDYINNGGELWEKKDKIDKVSQEIIRRREETAKAYKAAGDKPLTMGLKLENPGSGKTFMKDITSNKLKTGGFSTGVSSSNKFNIASQFGEATQNKTYQSNYVSDLTNRYTKVSSYKPQPKIQKWETFNDKLDTMDKISNQGLGFIGKIKNLDKPKTVYIWKGEDTTDEVTGKNIRNIYEDVVQVNVVAENKDYYFYRVAKKGENGSIQRIEKHNTVEEIPDLEKQKILYMQSVVENNGADKNATLAEKMWFNLGEGMRKMALGGTKKAQIPTGNKVVDKVTDVGGDILGFMTPTGATGNPVVNRLDQALSQGAKGILGKVAQKTPTAVSKQITSGIGQATLTGATEMGMYSGLEKENQSGTDGVKRILENMVMGSVFMGTTYMGGKGIKKLITSFKNIPETPETLSLIEAAEKEYMTQFDHTIKNVNSADESTKISQEAADKFYNTIKKIEERYKNEAQKLGEYVNTPIGEFGKTTQQPKGDLNLAENKISNEGKLNTPKNSSANEPSKVLTSNENLGQKSSANKDLLNEKSLLETKLKSLLDSEKTGGSNENLTKQISDARNKIKDLDLQLLGTNTPNLPTGINPNITKTGEHIQSSATKKSLAEKVKSGWETFYRQVVDRNRSLQVVTNYATKGKGLVANDPHRLSNIASSYEGIAKSNIEQYVSDNTGKKVGDSLRTVMESIPKNKSEQMKDYMVLKHAAFLAEHRPEVGQVYPKEWGLTAKDMKFKLDIMETENPEFRRLSAKFTKYNNDIAKTQLVDSGLLSEEEYNAAKKVNPFFTPFKRVMEDVEVGKSSPGTKASYVGQGKQFKSREGSERQVIDPMMSMITNTFNYAKAAKRNEVGQALYKLAAKDPEKLKPFLEIVKKVPDKNLTTRIQEGDLAGFVDDINSGFEIKGVKDLSKPNIVRIRIKGKDAYMKINDAQLLDNLTYLNTDQLNSVLEVSRKITGNMKILTTGLNPMFGIAKNIWKDLVTGFMQSKTVGKIPVINYVGYMKDLMGAAIGSTFKTTNYREYRALGGGFFSSALGTEKDLLAETVAKYSGGKTSFKGKVARTAKKVLIDPIEWVNNTLETMPRFSEYSRTVKQLQKAGVGEKAAKLEGIYNGQDVTVNFQRSGEFSKGTDALVPYFNAAIQGIDKTLRTLDPRNPKELANVVSKGITSITIPAMLLYSINHKNEKYQQLSDYIKDNNFLIPYGKDGQFIKIPKPREFGVLFGSLPERIMRAYADKDPQAFDKFTETIKQNFSPPNPITENILFPIGRNIISEEGRTWRGTPVVGQQLLQKSPAKQYDENTSAVAKKIGEILDFSPKKVDEIFKSYLGGVAQVGIPLTSSRTKNEKGVINAAIEVLKKQVTADSKYNTDLADQFYTNMKNVAMKKADNPQKGDETYIDRASYIFSKASEQVSELRNEQRAAKTNKEKDKIQQEMIKVYKKTIEDYNNNYLKKKNMTSFERKREFTRKK